ncbi:hypothetical protein C9I98_13870 [Photobacterium sanctipauli]|uniref:DUF5363 domain-containing protein n=1 Tax=Photobacterium sanctipauli TaxID=1342794 RepID=A0A2T3NRT2_9GAMM|nr:hypothetical protein [Photobacterium sanctipauli]PSW18937.1 hypothetical protein C9I98_13870 [Photobacterium sanctipauli]
MLATMKKWVAAYDRWCERMGFVPENRRCCAPVRYDHDDERHPDNRHQQSGTTCDSKHADR